MISLLPKRKYRSRNAFLRRGSEDPPEGTWLWRSEAISTESWSDRKWSHRTVWSFHDQEDREGRENPSPAQASLRTVLEEGKK